MVVFLLSASLTYLFWPYLRNWWTNRDAARGTATAVTATVLLLVGAIIAAYIFGLSVYGWAIVLAVYAVVWWPWWEPVKTWWHGNYPPVVAALVGFPLLFAALYALQTGSLTPVRHAVFAPETAHAMLGALAGVLSRELWAWTGASPFGDDGWRLSIFVSALAAVTLAALLAPYASIVLNRISEVGSPWVEIKFSASIPEKQVVLDIDRDVMRGADSFEDLPRAVRYIEYDCGQRGA